MAVASFFVLLFQMRLFATILVLIVSLFEICSASRLNAEQRLALFRQINDYANGFLNLTSAHPATSEFLNKAKSAGLSPQASDFAHIFVGVDENEKCYRLKRKRGAKYGMSQVEEIAKVLYEFYLTTKGNLNSPFSSAIFPKSWKLCREFYYSTLRYHYSSQQQMQVTDRLRGILSSRNIMDIWERKYMFPYVDVDDSIGRFWDIFDPIGNVMPILRNSAFEKFDTLGKALNPPRKLSFSQKEDLFTSILSKMIYFGPLCDTPLSSSSLRKVFEAAEATNAGGILCLDASGGKGPAKDISTRVRNKKVKANLLQAVSQVIDKLTAKEVYSQGTRSLRDTTGMIAVQTKSV